jgi:hypothetical protein
VFLPCGIPHSLKNIGPTVARVLAFSTPAGLDQYFVEGGTPALSDGLPPQAIDAKLFDALAGQYGQEILGSPPF